MNKAAYMVIHARGGQLLRSNASSGLNSNSVDKTGLAKLKKNRQKKICLQ